MQRILIDTDPGIDDALALLLAFASPEIKVEAITAVSGNVNVEQTSYNALALSEFFGRPDVPVARGSALPLFRSPVDAGYYHGKNGIGEVTLPAPRGTVVAQRAVDLIVQKVMDAPGELTLVALGPLTNLAMALRLEPAIAQAVREVVIMGGALRSRGNITPAGEFNIVADPHAADIVFHAGWPIRLVSLDVSNLVLLREEHIQHLRQTRSAIAEFIKQMIDYNATRHAVSQGFPGFPMHDPLCLSVVMRPDFIVWEDVYVAVEVQGSHTLGETVAYFPEYGTAAPHAPNVRASVRVDAEGFLEWYVERVYQYLVRA